MVDSVSGDAPGLATALMNKKTEEENTAVALVKKAQDIEKAEGESALQLIESATPIQAGQLDVFV